MSRDGEPGQLSSMVWRSRRRGAVFDTILSEPEVDKYPLEEIVVPTLIVHAADDTLARYETAPPAAKRIPGVRLVTIERGGHLLLGAQDRVRAEVAGFIRSELDHPGRGRPQAARSAGRLRVGWPAP